MTGKTNTKALLIIITLTCLLIGSVGPVAAGSFRLLTLSDMVRQADLIFTGTAQKVSVEWSSDGEAVFTFVTFGDLSIIKGNYEASTLNLRQKGGRMGGLEMIVTGAPVFQENERLLLFLAGNNIRLCPVVGYSQGIFTVLTELGNADPPIRNYHDQFINRIADDRIVLLEDNFKPGDEQKLTVPVNAMTVGQFAGAIQVIMAEQPTPDPTLYNYENKNYNRKPAAAPAIDRMLLPPPAPAVQPASALAAPEEPAAVPAAEPEAGTEAPAADVKTDQAAEPAPMTETKTEPVAPEPAAPEPDAEDESTQPAEGD